MIRTDGLTRTFNNFLAVDSLSLEVRDGEVFGFIGPNGAGKTTTLRMLACLIKPTMGTATINGHSIDKEEDRMKIRSQIGLLPENPGLYETLSAYQNLNFYGELHGMTAEARASSIERLLKLLGIWERKDETIGTFSRGMKQKIAIARALVHDPKYLFLDEPTASLDPLAVSKVRDFLGELKGKGHTIFINTHNLDEAERLCDRVGIFNKRLIAIGRPKELADRLWPKSLSIVTDGIGDEVMAHIRELEGVGDVKMEDNVLKVATDRPDIHGSEIAGILLDSNVRIISLREETHSLEDLYLEYMGGKR